MIADIHQTTGHGVRQICATLKVSRSSYYHACAPTLMQSSDQKIGVEIEAVFKGHRRRYGYRRIKDELEDQAACWTWSVRVRELRFETEIRRF